MADVLSYWSEFKSRKTGAWYDFAQNAISVFNHPHRVAQISITGTLGYTIDERDFDGAENRSIADVFQFSLDVSPHPPWARVFLERTPRLGVLSIDDEEKGSFYLLHRPFYMWAIQYYRNPYAPEDDPNVGTCTRTRYERDVNDEWQEESSDTSQIVLYFEPFYGINTSGGHPQSGGKDDAHPTKFYPAFTFSTTEGNDYTSYLSFLDFQLVERNPWDAEWGDEDYSGVFNDHVDLQNSEDYDGGGHSGSCSIKIEFTNQS